MPLPLELRPSFGSLFLARNCTVWTGQAIDIIPSCQELRNLTPLVCKTRFAPLGTDCALYYSDDIEDGQRRGKIRCGRFLNSKIGTTSGVGSLTTGVTGSHFYELPGTFLNENDNHDIGA